MPIITIKTNFDGFAFWDVIVQAYGKMDYYDNILLLSVGRAYVEKDSVDQWRRTFLRFPLTTLPSGATVTQVRLYVRVGGAGGAAHLTDIHPYNSDGQADPEPDGAEDCYNRCAAGTPYINDSDALRTEGDKWFDLGAQACTDVQNAKTAVNRFSLGLHEEGDNDPHAVLYALFYEEIYGNSWAARLEITYTEALVVGYSYSDGLVSITV